MKNTIKLLGIIAIVAVMGFSMTACEEEKEDDNKGNSKLTIVNNYSKPITKVTIGSVFQKDNLSITTSQSFDIDWEGAFTGSVILYAEGLGSSGSAGYIGCILTRGKTTTFTLNANGTITAVMP